MGHWSALLRGASVGALLMSMALGPVLTSCNPSSSHKEASAKLSTGRARWNRFAESSAGLGSNSAPPVPFAVIEPAFMAALRSELPDARIESAEGRVTITRSGATIEISTKAIAAPCPGEGAACDAAAGALARATAHDILDPPSCAGQPLEPELLMDEDTGDDVLSARVAGRLHVGVAAYMDHRTVRSWCSASEAPGVSSERVLSWAREQVAARPPPPIEPMPERDGMWMIVEKGEVAVYFLDASRLLAAIKEPKGPLVAIVPSVHMVFFTTADRKDLVADLRVIAKAYAHKPGARGLSEDVYQWHESEWQVLPP